ncbi:MAG: hypothetical protein BMS9Abin02_1638 [Anaerolineae bacterium]|nr:MAG: hypothetical protein BMS9Abin02_1638 [Anaerolineae bacterium]
MGRLVHAKTAIANNTKAFLFTILALLHISVLIVPVPFKGFEWGIWRAVYR